MVYSEMEVVFTHCLTICTSTQPCFSKTVQSTVAKKESTDSGGSGTVYLAALCSTFDHTLCLLLASVSGIGLENSRRLI